MTDIEKELELAKFERDRFSVALQISENKLRLERTMRLQCADDSSMDLKRALAAEEKLLSAEGVILLWQNKCEIAKFERDTLAEALNQLCAEIELFETRKVALDEAKKTLAILKDRNA